MAYAETSKRTAALNQLQPTFLLVATATELLINLQHSCAA